MSIGQDALKALLESHDVTDPGERLFVERINETGLLTAETFGSLLHAHREGSGRTFDDLMADKPASEAASVPAAQESTWTRGGTAPERGRAAILARHVARLAAASFEVRTFRRWLLGDPSATMPAKQARRFLGSPALGYLSREDIEALGMPLGGHASTVAERSLGRKRRLAESGPGREVTLRLTSPGHRARTATRVVRMDTAAMLHLPDRPSLHTYPGSVLDVVRRRAQSVATRYGWPESAALLFLLTGETPTVMAVWVRASISVADQQERRAFLPVEASITVRAMAHVAPESVARAFAREQRHITGHRKGREIEPRNVALVDFMVQEIGEHGLRPFAQHMERWNTKNKKTWHYKYPSRMERDYRDTAVRLFLLDIDRDFGKPEARLKLLERVLGSSAHPVEAQLAYVPAGTSSPVAHNPRTVLRSGRGCERW